MAKTDILLINPPFAMPDKPCMSIPVLAGYLKSRGFKIQVLDLNIKFYHDFLSPEHVSQGFTYIRQRVAGLKEKATLEPLEAAEYTHLQSLLKTIPVQNEWLYDVFANKEFPGQQQLELFRVALGIVAAPYFPETLSFTFNTRYIRYKSAYSHFSSLDIIESLGRRTLFADSITRLLTTFFKNHSPRVVGISVSFPDMVMPAFKCAAIIKAIDPGIHITLGGSFVSVHMRELQESSLFKVVDSFILDDGEIPLEILIQEQTSMTPNLARVPGIMYMSKEKGTIIKHAPAPPLEMAQLPPPDYTLFPMDKYLVKKESMNLLFRLSRGCYWAKCTFCRTRLPFIRHHDQPPAQHLFQQLETLVAQTGTHRFIFTDEAASPEVLEKMCLKILDSKLRIQWGTNFRIDKGLTLERLMLYKRAGCYAVSVGLESYSARVLKLMKKGFNEALVEKVLSNFSWAGIDVSLYMIVGFPTETEEEAWASFEKIEALKEKELITHCVYNIFELAPYSAVAAAPADFGISTIYRIKKRDLSPPVSRFDSTGMTREKANQLCYLFIDRLSQNPVTGIQK